MKFNLIDLSSSLDISTFLRRSIVACKSLALIKSYELEQDEKQERSI